MPNSDIGRSELGHFGPNSDSTKFGVLDGEGGKHKLSELGRLIVDRNQSRAARMRAFLNVAWPLGTDTPPVDDKNKGGGGGGGGNGGGPTGIDPIIQGLLARLPKAGDV